MNKTLPLLAVWLVVCGFSCATADLETNAYKTIGTISVTVDGTMNLWGDYKRSGGATPEQEAKVRAAHEHYQQVMATTHKAIIAYKAAPENATALDTALRTVEAVGADLIAIIRQLIPAAELERLERQNRTH